MPGTYEHLIIRNKAGLTIGHLDAACYLRFTCRKCGRVYRIPPHRFLARYPPWWKLDRIARDAGCHTCATHRGHDWAIMRAVSPRHVVNGG